MGDYLGEGRVGYDGYSEFKEGGGKIKEMLMKTITVGIIPNDETTLLITHLSG
jgi:hypothetical protein